MGSAIFNPAYHHRPQARLYLVPRLAVCGCCLRLGRVAPPARRRPDGHHSLGDGASFLPYRRARLRLSRRIQTLARALDPQSHHPRAPRLLVAQIRRPDPGAPHYPVGPPAQLHAAARFRPHLRLQGQGRRPQHQELRPRLQLGLFRQYARRLAAIHQYLGAHAARVALARRRCDGPPGLLDDHHPLRPGLCRTCDLVHPQGVHHQPAQVPLPLCQLLPLVFWYYTSFTSAT
jgi:hypothetical protein